MSGPYAVTGGGFKGAGNLLLDNATVGFELNPVEIRLPGVMSGMKRTLMVFFGLAALVFLFDQVARRVIGLDCMGPVLPVWGCLADPYASVGTVGDFSGVVLTYGGVLLATLVVAYLVRNLAFTVGGYLLGRYRPDVAAKLSGEEPKGYRVR